LVQQGFKLVPTLFLLERGGGDLSQRPYIFRQCGNGIIAAPRFGHGKMPFDAFEALDDFVGAALEAIVLDPSLN